jgi:hypothetical protein
MTKYLKIAGVLVLCVLIFFGVKMIFFKSYRNDKEVVAFVRGMNKECPTMVDHETRLDAVFAYAVNNLEFHYTLVNMVKDSIPIPNLKNYMEPVIIEKIKNSGTLRKLLNKNLTWIYSFKDKNGDFIFKVTYTPDQFK